MSRTSLILRGAGALAVLYAAAPAAGQSFPALRVGHPVEAALSAEDPAFAAHGRFRVYRFEAVAGETYMLSLVSRAFDPSLAVAWSVGGLTEVLASNDDAGGGTDARLRWRAPASGAFLAVARSPGRDAVGPFVLSLERAPEPTTAAPRPVRVGETVAGALAETDRVEEADGSFFDSYLLQARRGDRLRIEMRSDAFDTFLSLGRGGAAPWEALETDDDGLGDGTGSRLLVTIPEDGEYVIRANSVGAAAVGAYTLGVAIRPPAGAPVARPLAAGAEVAGTLEDGDPETAEGALYELYALTGTAGERYLVRMESSRFDTVLSFGRLVDGAFEEIAGNDDAGEGTDSALEVVLPAGGEYGIRAQALTPGMQGAYRLRVERAR